jgi:hypothetical protein
MVGVLGATVLTLGAILLNINNKNPSCGSDVKNVSSVFIIMGAFLLFLVPMILVIHENAKRINGKGLEGKIPGEGDMYVNRNEIIKLEKIKRKKEDDAAKAAIESKELYRKAAEAEELSRQSSQDARILDESILLTNQTGTPMRRLKKKY